MAVIREVGPGDTDLLSGLHRLLRDAVEGGASIGFVLPLADEPVATYWLEVVASLGDARVLWIATEGDAVVGAIQLSRCEKANGRHRAEVQKLMVLRTVRGRGIASRLMAALEAHARALGLRLLSLDTETGSEAESVYRHLGWIRAGEIPDYAARPDGTLHPTTHYFKLLDRSP